jgi:small subunit ribosomal protein S8
LHRPKKNLNILPGLSEDVFVVGEGGGLCEPLAYVEFVLGNWRIEEKFRELKNPHGNFKFQIQNMTDPITDMLNRIKNAQAVGKTEVVVPFSHIKSEIARVLLENGFLGDVKKITKGKAKALKINLKYVEGIPAIEGVKRVSKPGQRIYSKVHDMKRVRGGYGISVVSTSKGLMAGMGAKKAKLGGEILLEVW